MSNVVRNVAALAGVAVLAGGVAYFAATRQNGSPPAPPQALPPTSSTTPPAPFATPAPAPPQQAAPQQAAPAPTPSQDAEADPTVWPQGVLPEKFTTSARAYTLVRDSAAYAAPSGDAPQLYPLKAGTALVTTDRSTDGKWVISMTEDGRAAYLLAADLGPYDPSRHPASDLPEQVDGPARVIDTATLLVGGQTLALTGVTGVAGDYADKLQKIIDLNGAQVSCSLSGQTYQCRLPNGQDIARQALFNGAARAADDASPDYRAQEAQAQTFHRGVWH